MRIKKMILFIKIVISDKNAHKIGTKHLYHIINILIFILIN